MERIINLAISSIILITVCFETTAKYRAHKSCNLFIEYMYNHESILMYYWDYSECVTC